MQVVEQAPSVEEATTAGVVPVTVGVTGDVTPVTGVTRALVPVEAFSLTPPAPAAKRPARERKPTNPRFAPLKLAMEAAYREVKGGTYGFDGGKDAAAVAALVAMSQDNAEVVRRYRLALADPRGPSGFAAFRQRFNDYAQAGPGRAPTVSEDRMRRAPVRSGDVDWSLPAGGRK